VTGRRRAMTLAWTLARRRGLMLGVSLLAALGAAACTALVAERMGALAAPAQLGLPALTVLAGLVLARALFIALRTLCTMGFARWFSHDLRTTVYRQLLSAGDLGAVGRGDAVGRILQDTNQLHYFASSTVGELTTQAASSAALISVMARHDLKMTLLLTISAPVLAWVLIRGLARSHAAYVALGQRQASLSNEATELLGFLRLSKAYGAEEAFLTRFEQRSRALATQHGQVALSTTSLAPVLMLVGLGTIALLLVGWSRTPGPLLSPARISFLTACALLYRPLVSAAQSMASLSMVLAAVDRLGELLSLASRPSESKTRKGRRSDASFVLYAGRFAYAGAPVLEEVTLRVSHGEMVAIVGENGAGKSTLLELCLGLLKPERGTLTLPRHGALEFDPDACREHFAWMPQEPLLVSGSVLDNVALGSGAPDSARAERALRSAGAWDLVERLEGALQANIGETGRKLSRGEAQRVCLARALYRDVPCLLLDEPTAFLDGIAAGELVSTVRALRKHTTLVVVTHALGLAAVADRVIVIAHGRVVEEGKPAELWSAKGAFFTLFQAQHDPLSGL